MQTQTLNKDDFLLASDVDDNGNFYWFIYNWSTYELLAYFDNEGDAQTYFDNLPG